MKKQMLKQTALLLLMGLAACYPEPDLSDLEDELAVVTNYDPTADFANYATFAIPDSIGIITDDEDNEEFVDDAKATTVLSAVRTNMLSAGFTEVNKEDDPDIGVNVIVLENLNVGGLSIPVTGAPVTGLIVVGIPGMDGAQSMPILLAH